MTQLLWGIKFASIRKVRVEINLCKSVKSVPKNAAQASHLRLSFATALTKGLQAGMPAENPWLRC